MLLLKFILLGAPLFILFVLAKKSGTWLEILPSLFWYFFISLPYIFLVNFLDGYSLNVQFIGIVMISLFLFVADYIGIRTYDRNRVAIIDAREGFVTSNAARRLLALAILLFSVLLPLLQVLATHTFPLGQLFFFDSKGFDLADARQRFTKGADFPIFFEVLLAWYIPLFASLGIYLLRKLHFKYLSYGFIIFLSFYSFIGLEKVPFVFLILTLLIALSNSNNVSVKIRKIFTLGVACLLLILTFVGQIYLSQVKRDVNFINSSEYTSSKLLGHLTPSDTYRLEVRPSTNIPAPILGLTYRTVLTPVDVSFRFYQYFTFESERRRDWLEIITLREDPKGTNIVGNWAFTERFPSKYTQYIDAYTSIDADSFSIFGIWGVLIAGLLLCTLRYSFTILRFKSQFGMFAYGICISYLSFMPFQSGLASMLLSKGLLALLFLTWAVSRTSSRRQ